jgi:hypothetical protein
MKSFKEHFIKNKSENQNPRYGKDAEIIYPNVETWKLGVEKDM